jgi:hypothetical protein
VKLRIALGREPSNLLQVDATDFRGEARVSVLARGEVVASADCADPPCHALVRIPDVGMGQFFGIVVENEGRTTEIELGIGESQGEP